MTTAELTQLANTPKVCDLRSMFCWMECEECRVIREARAIVGCQECKGTGWFTVYADGEYKGQGKCVTCKGTGEKPE